MPAARRSRRAPWRARWRGRRARPPRTPYTANENRCHFASCRRLARVLAVTRLRAARRRRWHAPAPAARRARRAGGQPGFVRGRVGRVGRRTGSARCWSPSGRGRVPTAAALSAYDVKIAFAELMAYVVDEPSAFEVAGRALAAGRVAPHPPTITPPTTSRMEAIVAKGTLARRAAATTPSSASASAGASSTRAARSTAAPAPPGTTARWASSSRRTSAASGGARWCSAATTSSASTPRSSWPARCGWPPATSTRSPTR